MKIAVISDIHGNMDAVNAVMADIEKQNCTKLFVLGDYAMAGPEPKAAINFFMSKRSDSNVIMIQGNTDVMISEYNFDLYDSLKEKAPVMAEALKNDARIIEHDEKEFLRALPIQQEVFLEGVRFLLVHGSPRKNNEDIMPDTDLRIVEEMLVNVDADVVLCGHTHIPCGFQTPSKKTVVNVGSIGRPFTQEPKSCYLVITVENGQTLFEHRFVKYDNKSAYEKLKKRDFWGSDRLAETLINPKVRHF